MYDSVYTLKQLADPRVRTTAHPTQVGDSPEPYNGHH